MSVLKFETAFKYPFNRPKGLLNVLWMFLPIFGWFALGGYTIRIIREFVHGKFKKLPEFSFKSDMNLGFFMFLKAIPFFIAYWIVQAILYSALGDFTSGVIDLFIAVMIIPTLSIHFMYKGTVQSYFEFKKLEPVFKNVGDYLFALLKSIGLGLVFFVMIIVLVGIPAGVFTKNMFLADFYRRKVK